MNRTIELLSPAGDRDALVSAIENGADAVYLGMKSLNARKGAGNFDDDALRWAADYCHERGKRVYVTVNTVVKQEEFSILYDVAESLARAGADAAIVQDFGVAHALHAMLPSLELHASTQMAAHNRQAARYLKQRGFTRAVLAREMTFSEILACANEGIEVEVFCHGALCVASSGQCLFSSMVGGRSGNRGMCAQPCRLPYRLENERGKVLSEGHLLSTKDIETVHLMEEMRKAHVSSLKIEGRLKRPEYVAIVTGIYRRALDGDKITQDDHEALLQIFNRGGFTPGYAPGVIDGTLISKTRPSHWGVKVGQCDRNGRVHLLKDVSSADALSVRTEKGEDVPVKISGKSGETVRTQAAAGDLMRLVHEEQMALARETVRETKRVIPLKAEIEIVTGRNAKATVTDGVRTAEVTGWLVEKSQKAQADPERVKAQISKTGATPYFFETIQLTMSQDAFAPASGLNALRRDALEAMSQMRISELRGCERTVRPYEACLLSKGNAGKRIIVQSGSMEMLSAALLAGADEIAYEPKDISAGGLDQIHSPEKFFLVLPPVMPDASLEYVHRWAVEHENALKGVYLSNVGHMAYFWPGEIRYDFSMNLANSEAIRFLDAEKCVYTPSVELTAKEIEKIGGNRELIVYGRIPLMHLRHCPLNAAMNGGKHSECRRCDQAEGRNKLNGCIFRDRMNARFPLSRLKTETGCVIDVLNSVPMSLHKHMEKLPSASGYRILITDEDEATVFDVVRTFRNALNGTFVFNEEAKQTANYTTGHYFRPVE